MKIVPNLTGLRFVLAFLVIIYHVPQFCENRNFPFFNDLPLFQKGQEAVYMFFSLSGFLIIGKLYAEKGASGSIDLKAFFMKRILRIFPLYYLVLTFGFFYYWLMLPNLGFQYANDYDLPTGLFLSYTFFPNIFATYNPGGIIEILWSIGIEEQFYLFIAPVLFFLPFKNIFRFLILFTVAYFTLYFSELVDFISNFNMLFFYFSASGIFAILFINQRNSILKFRYFIYVIFIIYFATSFFASNLSTAFYHLFSMLLFGFTIFCLASNPVKILENKVMIYLGTICYGIYMYHAIMMQAVGFLYLKTEIHLKITSDYAILIFNVLVIIATVFISHFSYNYFESYFLKKKKLLYNTKI
jgi:peptidoglycan/LPS O-acetylase OafA/YrhL